MKKISLMEIEEEIVKNGLEISGRDFIAAIEKTNKILSDIFRQKNLVIENVIVRLELFVEAGRFFVIEFLFDGLGRLKQRYSRFLVMFREKSDIFCTVFIPSQDFYEAFDSSPEPYLYTVDKIESILKKHGLKLNISLLGVEFTIPFDVEVKEYLI